MLRSRSYTVKANDFNVQVKDSKCGGQHLILLRLMTLMLRSRTLNVEVNILYY